MKVDIKINGKWYKPINNTFSITKQVARLTDIKERKTSFTSQFTIPMIKDFAPFKEVNYTNVSLSNEFLKVDLFVKGTPILQGHNGVIGGYDLSKGTFNLVIIGKETTLKNKLTSKKIKDLDLSDLIHDISYANFENNVNNDSGFVYAISDYGNTIGNNGTVNIDYLMPAVYIKTIWQKILAMTGKVSSWQPEADILLTSIRGWKQEDGNVNTFDYFYNTGLGEQTGNGYMKVPFEPIQVAIQDNIYELKIIESGYYDFNVHGRIEVYDGDWANFGNMYIMKKDSNGNEVTLAEIQPIYTYVNGVRIKEYAGSINYFADAGDTVYAYIQGWYDECYTYNPTGSPGDEITECPEDYLDFFGMLPNDKFFEHKTADSQNAQYLPEQLIGNIGLWDFFKDMLIYHGVLYWIDENEIHIKRIDDVINEAEQMPESSKFIKVTKIKKRPEKYAQINEFKYKKKSEENTEIYDTEIKVLNETIPDKKVFFERIYQSVKESSLSLNGKQLVGTQVWKPEFDDDGNIKKWKSINTIPYFIRVDTENGSFDYKTTSGQTETYNGDYKIATDREIGLNNVKENYYTQVERILNHYNELDIEYYMPMADFLEFELTKAKYIPELNIKIYINKATFKDNVVKMNVLQI